jgi:hypothetical protein
MISLVILLRPSVLAFHVLLYKIIFICRSYVARVPVSVVLLCAPVQLRLSNFSLLLLSSQFSHVYIYTYVNCSSVNVSIYLSHISLLMVLVMFCTF